MKKILTFAVATLFAYSANAQLLYKISGKGLKEPSYVFGTYHLANASFADKVPGMTDALANTQQVYGELSLTSQQHPDSLSLLQSAMMLPEGKTIKDVLTADQYVKLNELFKKAIGVEFDNPQIFGAMGKMSPSGLETQITLILAMRYCSNEINPNDLIDMSFQRKALAENKTIAGLETLAFQKSVLFGKPIEQQVEGLMCLADNFDMNVKLTKDLYDAYHSQDAAKIKEVGDFKFNNSCDMTPEEEDRFLYSRNADWIKKMPAIMKSKPTFFAVGALHLLGDRGVLNLLTNAGYKVEAVK